MSFDIEIPPSHCPACKRELDVAHRVHGKSTGPKPGFFLFCLYCAALLKFGPKLEPLAVPASEFGALPAAIRRNLIVAQDQVLQVIAARRTGEI